MSFSVFGARLFTFVFLLLAFPSLAQQRNPGLVTDNGSDQTQAQIDAHKELTGEARARRIAAQLGDHGMPATVLLCDLHKDISSRSAKAGDEVLLSLRKPATLPGGMVLPRGTIVRGHVVQAAAHTKTYRNGAILLNFDEVRAKGAPETPIFALIAAIAPSENEQHGSNGAIHEGTIGGTSNSPNAGILLQGGMGDAVVGQSTLISGIPGLTLVASAGGSGVLVAPNDNASMFGSQEMTLIVGLATPEATTQRAYAVLHPAKPSAAGSGAGTAPGAAAH